MITFHRAIGWAVVAFCAAAAGVAHAGGVFDSIQGNVTVIAPDGNRSAAQRFAAIPPGSVISTGSGSQAVLRFDDQSAVVLNQNTDFRVVDYQYEPAKPEASRSVFDFLKGAARFVTGLIARAEPANYKLRTQQMTIGVRGTDFSLASGSLYLSVLHGVVTGTNAAGTVAFGAGQLGFAPNRGDAPGVDRIRRRFRPAWRAPSPVSARFRCPRARSRRRPAAARRARAARPARLLRPAPRPPSSGSAPRPPSARRR